MRPAPSADPETSLRSLVEEIRTCRLCAGEMPREPRPILRAAATARILIASQAPGNLAANSGTPFNDPSGDRLRDWMGVDRETFYDESKIAIVPMGFCFPGYDKKGGDLPPMKRCAPTWRADVLTRLPRLKVTLVIGGYAQKWHLGDRVQRTLTETVQNWRVFREEGLFVLPHPSWRNTAWLKRNEWFERDVLPELRGTLLDVLSASS